MLIMLFIGYCQLQSGFNLDEQRKVFVNYQMKLENEKIDYLKAQGKYDGLKNKEQELVLQNLKNPYI